MEDPFQIDSKTCNDKSYIPEEFVDIVSNNSKNEYFINENYGDILPDKVLPISIFIPIIPFFLDLDFFSGTFTIHRAAGERRGYLFNYFHSHHRHLEISQAITAEN